MGRPWASGDESLRFSATWGEFDLDPLTLARKAVCGVGASLAGDLSATGWAGGTGERSAPAVPALSLRVLLSPQLETETAAAK